MTEARPFRFGVLCTSAIGSPAEWKELARRAEALGYDSLLATDHLDGPDLAPIPALAVAAEVTDRLTLGCHVFNNDLRHPAVLARELATLDVLTAGRLEVGMGAGWKHDDYVFRGVEPDAPATRIERLDEAVSAMKALLAGEVLTCTGKHYAFDHFTLAPPPVQRPRPPLMIGGGGRRILSLAAREADIVGFNLALATNSLADALRATSLEATRRKVDWVKQEANERFVELELNVVVYFTGVGPHGDAALAAYANSLGLSPEDVLESPHVLAGPVETVVETLDQRRAELGISYFSIPDRDVESFAPVVARCQTEDGAPRRR